MRRKMASLLVAFVTGTMISGCDYVRLLRPSVLKQLNPEVVALVNELPNVDKQNEEMIGHKSF